MPKEDIFVRMARARCENEEWLKKHTWVFILAVGAVGVGCAVAGRLIMK